MKLLPHKWVSISRAMTIREAKQRHEDELLRIGGVQGIGLCLLRGYEVIAVYTLGESVEIPEEVEGHKLHRVDCRRDQPRD